MDLMLKSGSFDPELDAHSMDMLNAIRMFVATHCPVRLDRKLKVKKVVNSALGKELIKMKREIYRELPELSELLLLGDNLGDKNKEHMKSVKASENYMMPGMLHRGKCRFKRGVLHTGSEELDVFAYSEEQEEAQLGARDSNLQREMWLVNGGLRSIWKYTYLRGGRGKGTLTQGFLK